MIRYKHPLRSYYVYYGVVPENIHTSTEGTFTLDPTPWNFRGFPTWLGTPGKNISVKNAVALYYYAKNNCFCDEMRKKFIHV